ncbi:MAG: metal-dependent hydrolase [Gammaproteobacteria bacterium]|nr:metal-dependent hydrolase [Gammaproteobacteria bacterium]MCP5426260.1 metal-dependent hydrolase [Gammaproteobacteria bacterium]
MDSLRQLTLGAAVGEAVLGRKIGARAALWSGLFGTLPDLDVLAKPFIAEIQKLAVHHGITYSLAMVALGSPLVG